jgi:transcriptional regulator with XRE-family HTH domain
MARKKIKSTESINQTLGAQLRSWRTYSGLRQRELEERAGLAHNAISRIEKGEVSPRLETIERLAQALDISVEEFQFRIPPANSRKDIRKDTQEWTQGLIERLDEMPQEVREPLLKIIQSIIDLIGKE